MYQAISSNNQRKLEFISIKIKLYLHTKKEESQQINKKMMKVIEIKIEKPIAPVVV